MRPAAKLALIDKIGRELDSRFDYNEIAFYLHEYDIPSSFGGHDSKLEYAKDALQGASSELLEKMAEDLVVKIKRKIPR
jgi:hypothetical protein